MVAAQCCQPLWARAFFQAFQRFHAPSRFRGEIKKVFSKGFLSHNRRASKVFCFDNGGNPGNLHSTLSRLKIEHPGGMSLRCNCLSCKPFQIRRQWMPSLSNLPLDGHLGKEQWSSTPWPPMCWKQLLTLAKQLWGKTIHAVVGMHFPWAFFQALRSIECGTPGECH